MRCYLAQHGQACCAEEDPARPLSGQGREDIARVAGFLSLFTKPAPTTIYCSGKLRAQQSAAMFAEGWNIPVPQISDDLDPRADPQCWLDRLERSEEDLMLVGHLPHLSLLASHLLLGHGNGAPIKFANGGVVCLERADGHWQICWQVNPTQFYPAD